MEVSQELEKAKDVLNNERETAYRNALHGDIAIDIDEAGKLVTVNGGLDNLWSLQTAYESLFVDPDVPEIDASLKQADGSLVRCTQAEWEHLLKAMRNFGKNLFIKNEVVIAYIGMLTVDNTMAEVWNTTWENIDVPTE
jgi:hypothetical protein